MRGKFKPFLFDSLSPSQQFFSYVGIVFLGQTSNKQDVPRQTHQCNVKHTRLDGYQGAVPAVLVIAADEKYPLFALEGGVTNDWCIIYFGSYGLFLP